LTRKLSREKAIRCRAEEGKGVGRTREGAQWERSISGGLYGNKFGGEGPHPKPKKATTTERKYMEKLMRGGRFVKGKPSAYRDEPKTPLRSKRRQSP